MIAIQFLWALWGSKPARYAAIALAALLGAKAWIWSHDNKVKEEAFRRVNEQAAVITDQAVKARESANRPGSADRLRKKYCLDCTP